MDLDVPDNGGLPKHYGPGIVRGKLTPKQLRDAGVPEDAIGDFMEGARIGDILAKKGYNVDLTGDPRISGKVPIMRKTDPYYQDGKNLSNPDYRINGVLFDRKTVSKKKNMMKRINDSIGDSQARNFVIKVPEGKVPEFMDYLKHRMNKVQKKKAQTT